MARPIGITILGGLEMFGGVCTVALGVVFMRNPGGLTDMGIPPEFLSLGPALGVILIVSGIFNLALGWGLLKLFNWARVVMMVITGLGLGGAALGILTSGLAHEPIGTDVLRLAAFAIDGLIIWYLLRPESKNAFAPRRPGVPPAEPPLPPTA